jgi:DNA-directed RNA polymerase specialized sigma24 family protein
MAFDKAGTGILTGGDRPSYEIWISEVDSTGAQRDERVVKAARRLRHFFLRYRQRELGCPSLANTLAEQAVDKVCGTTNPKTIRHPHSYLKAAYIHVVDRYLHRERRFVSVDFERDDERLPTQLVSEAELQNLERLLQIKEVLAAMDQQTLSVFAARRAGYTGKEIARGLGITANALYTSYSRGLTRVIEAFGISPAALSDNQRIDGSEQRRARRGPKATAFPHPKPSQS